MSVSLAEVTATLLSGKPFAWKKSKTHAAGVVSLTEAGERRLLEYLLAADQAKVAGGDETLFAGLIAVWDNAEHDPARWSSSVIRR
jgi:hypothetical protein